MYAGSILIACISLAGCAAQGQLAISARAGLIDYFEGAV